MTDSAPLSSRLRARIRAEGPISLEDFMAHAVRAYYASGTAFGRSGDFVTAPDVSQVFGELLGLWTAVTWQSMGAPAQVRLIELGPGRGTLMADALRAARRVPGFLDAVDLHLVEGSAVLRRKQAEALGSWVEGGLSCTWHDDLDQVPEGPTLLLANEFLDALPIRQYERVLSGWRERRVGLDPKTLDADEAPFVFVPGDQACDERVTALWAEGGDAPVGTLFEDSPVVRDYVGSAARRLVEQGGAALFIDYGYARTAAGDTLQAIRQHTFVPPLDNPGEVDLTAHVNFAAVTQSAEAAGAQVHGPVTQGRFLVGLGAEERARALLRTCTPEHALLISSGVRRLIHPNEMGTLFKAVAVTDPALPPPPGFEGSP